MEDGHHDNEMFYLYDTKLADEFDSLPRNINGQAHVEFPNGTQFTGFELEFDPKLYDDDMDENRNYVADSDVAEDDVFPERQFREYKDRVNNSLGNEVEFINISEKECQDYGFFVFLHGRSHVPSPAKKPFTRSQRLSTQDSGIVEEFIFKSELPPIKNAFDFGELDSVTDEGRAFSSRGSSCDSLNDELNVDCHVLHSTAQAESVGLLRIADQRPEDGEIHRVDPSLDGETMPVFDLDFDPGLYCKPGVHNVDSSQVEADFQPAHCLEEDFDIIYPDEYQNRVYSEPDSSSPIPSSELKDNYCPHTGSHSDTGAGIGFDDPGSSDSIIAVIHKDNETRPYFIDTVDGDTIEFALSKASYLSLELSSHKVLNKTHGASDYDATLDEATMNGVDARSQVERYVVQPLLRDAFSESLTCLAGEGAFSFEPASDQASGCRESLSFANIDEDRSRMISDADSFSAERDPWCADDKERYGYNVRVLKSNSEELCSDGEDFETSREDRGHLEKANREESILPDRDFHYEETEFQTAIELEDLHKLPEDVVGSLDIATVAEEAEYCSDKREEKPAGHQLEYFVGSKPPNASEDSVYAVYTEPVDAAKVDDVDGNVPGGEINHPVNSTPVYGFEQNSKKEHVFALTGKSRTPEGMTAYPSFNEAKKVFEIHPSSASQAVGSPSPFVDVSSAHDNIICSESFEESLNCEPEFNRSSSADSSPASPSYRITVGHVRSTPGKYGGSVQAASHRPEIVIADQTASPATTYTFDIRYQTCPVLRQSCVFEKILKPEAYSMECPIVSEDDGLVEDRLLRYTVELTVEKTSSKCISILQYYPKISV